mgnify:CR=1 FL=1
MAIVRVVYSTRKDGNFIQVRCVGKKNLSLEKDVPNFVKEEVSEEFNIFRTPPF